MVKDNQRLFNRIQVVIDAIVIIATYMLAWYLRFKSGLFDIDPWYLALQVYMGALIYIVPG
ncbi:MAG: undecaprenyl-phosphate glucose phosphotransferase, partial [Lachnospiraceae bacterium]